MCFEAFTRKVNSVGVYYFLNAFLRVLSVSALKFVDP